jgi:hypothetical protein
MILPYTENGLTWMILAQVFFAAMNVGTRLAARELPWSEIAAARFLVGILVAGELVWLVTAVARSGLLIARIPGGAVCSVPAPRSAPSTRWPRAGSHSATQ